MTDDKQQVPSVGRIVHMIMPNGEHRPAIIVKVWAQHPRPETACNLHVFFDKFDTGEQDVTSRQQGTAPGSWHWPEYVPPVPAS